MPGNFGGPWTEDKLDRVRKYLRAYTTIFAKNPAARRLTTIYVDAFAGTGYRSRVPREPDEELLLQELVRPDADEFLKGSAQIALEIQPSFNKYLFVERDPERARELRSLRERFLDKAARIEIVEAEANCYLQEWCERMDWRRNRAVVFLDPYGMEVEWPLLNCVAATQAIDLWILFPLGVAVNRLLTKGGQPPEGWADALTRTFGTSEWKEAFYTVQRKETLFGEVEGEVKVADFERIAKFFLERLGTVFTAVAEPALPLLNSRRIPLYLLCFAAGNPRGARTAVRIASHILRG